jgi:hypothetical protein
MSASSTTQEGRGSRALALMVFVLAGGVLASLVWMALGDTRASGAAASDRDEVILAQADQDEDSDENDAIDLPTIDVTYDLFLARDPFQTIRPPVPDPDPTEQDPTDPSPVQPTPTDPSPADPSPSPSPTPPEDGGACMTGTEAVCDGIVVTLDSVAAGAADFEVDGSAHTASPGDVFANHFQLLRIEGQCVDVLYADGDVFRLCLGDSVSK